MVKHKHLILRGKISNAPKREDTFAMEQWMRNFAKSQEMEIAGGPIASYVKEKGNRGMTASCLIKTSHVSLHVWDEEKPPLIQFDFYTCGAMDSKSVIEEIDDSFGLKGYEYMLLDRNAEDGIQVMERVNE